MSEEPKTVEVLEAQITAISETHTDRMTAPFPDLSKTAEKLQQLVHDAEIERNRMRSEE